MYAKPFYKICLVLGAGILMVSLFISAKRIYSRVDFGTTFGAKACAAHKKLQAMEPGFKICSPLSLSTVHFMQGIVFPEVMRYNALKDGIESESLQTLYVQFGEEYANFSVGIFQMKPSFAEQVEKKCKRLLPAHVYHELQLAYQNLNSENIRSERVKRLLDDEWQLVYLTAFIALCNKIYEYKKFVSETEKLQWYATVYNAGFNKTDDYISTKITEARFYLDQNMPDKKFNYAAIAAWYYEQNK